MSRCFSSFAALFFSRPFSVFRSPALVSRVAFSASSVASWASSSSAEFCSDSAPASPVACSCSSSACRLWALAYCFSNCSLGLAGSSPRLTATSSGPV